jgi:hypothetical protein
LVKSCICNDKLVGCAKWQMGSLIILKHLTRRLDHIS